MSHVIALLFSSLGVFRVRKLVKDNEKLCSCLTRNRNKLEGKGTCISSCNSGMAYGGGVV